MTKSTTLLSVFILAVLSVLSSSTFGAPGDLDTSFNGLGFVRYASNLGSDDSISATAVQPDGKIVSIGQVDYRVVNNLSFMVCGITRHNADGSLDTSFDGDGRTIVQVAPDYTCLDVAIQADEKIVVVGYIRTGSIYNFAIFRYNTDGSPDLSFDGDGRRITAFINADQARAVAIQPDGKILVCGSLGDEFVLVRYNSDGSFDGSFDGDGWVATDFFGGPDHARTIAIQPDGKILIAGNGRTMGGSFNDFAIARYNSNGSLDTSFDGDGKVLTDIQGNHDNAEDIDLQPDGKIVVAGFAWGSNYNWGFARYNTDGSLDTSFDGDGKVAYDIWAINDYVSGVFVQADGKIVAAGGGVAVGGSGQAAIVRLNSNGSLDTTLDGDGSMAIQIPGGGGRALSLATLADGRFVIGGSSTLNPNFEGSNFTVWRLNANATLDTSFDLDGWVATNIHTSKIAAKAIAIQADGKIVAVGDGGYDGTTNVDFQVNRYNPDGSFDASFDGDGKVTTQIVDTDLATAVVLQPDGKIVVAGHVNSELAIVRYNTNGSLDTSFDGDGKKTHDVFGSPKIFAVALQSDGKILVAGRRFFESVIYRFNTDGSIDNSFDLDGRVVPNFGGEDEISAIGVQPDGKIVVAGKGLISTYDFIVARYDSNGALDTSFDTDGIATIDFVGGYDYAKSLALQADGRIVVAGASNTSTAVDHTLTYDSALVRLNTNGSLDTSFDGDGKVRAPISNYFDAAASIVLQSDGKILTSGTAVGALQNDMGSNDIALVRYNANGSFDTSYGTAGKSIVGIVNNDHANALAIDSSGRAVIGGDTDGYFTVARFLGGSATPNVESPFDFDGDGKSDISIFRPSNGQWWYQRSSDNQVLAFQFGASTDRLVPSDYTGDGKTDIGFWRPSTGEWFILRSENYSFYAVPFGVNGDVPVPADFDNDGKADITVFRPSSGTWFINRSTGGTEIIGFGQNGDLPVAGDYDGDGKADTAIFRPSNGQWWLNRSTAGVIAVAFGSSTDRPVQGDYTGDGKTDVAFWRPSTGEWFVLRSEDFSYYAVPFGATGDTPTPGDYDGDGKFDTAVFRPSNQNWYINRTTSGLLIQQFGQAGDTPVPSAFVP